MCTVSWIHRAEGYDLLCNRDEKKTRSEATDPTVQFMKGVRYLAPVDGDFGGTWIATNEYGITLALLNRGCSGARGSASRGCLVVDLIDSRKSEEVRQRLSQRSLSAFGGFSLLALEPELPASLSEWDGKVLTATENAEHRMPLISSSFDSERVEIRRRLEFETRKRESETLNTDLLFEFHKSHGLQADAPSVYTTCMHRDDAHTVSFTYVRVSAAFVQMSYSPGAPCEQKLGSSVELARIGAVETRQ
jgi:hypothetical protein